jgi:hypothetical protein
MMTNLFGILQLAEMLTWLSGKCGILAVKMELFITSMDRNNHMGQPYQI